MLSNPATTNRAARDWLVAQGHPVSLSAVSSHRRRFTRERERRTYADDVAKWTKELAALDGLTEQDLAAGAVLRAWLGLFKEVRAAFRAAYDEGRPAAPKDLLAFAAALRLQMD